MVFFVFYLEVVYYTTRSSNFLTPWNNLAFHFDELQELSVKSEKLPFHKEIWIIFLRVTAHILLFPVLCSSSNCWYFNKRQKNFIQVIDYFVCSSWEEKPFQWLWLEYSRKKLSYRVRKFWVYLLCVLALTEKGAESFCHWLCSFLYFVRSLWKHLWWKQGSQYFSHFIIIPWYHAPQGNISMNTPSHTSVEVILYKTFNNV